MDPTLKFLCKVSSSEEDGGVLGGSKLIRPIFGVGPGQAPDLAEDNREVVIPLKVPDKFIKQTEQRSKPNASKANGFA